MPKFTIKRDPETGAIHLTSGGKVRYDVSVLGGAFASSTYIHRDLFVADPPETGTLEEIYAATSLNRVTSAA